MHNYYHFPGIFDGISFYAGDYAVYTEEGRNYIVIVEEKAFSQQEKVKVCIPEQNISMVVFQKYLKTFAALEREQHEKIKDDTPFKFNMFEDVIIRETGLAANVHGRFIEYKENGVRSVEYELCGPNIDRRYTEVELMTIPVRYASYKVEETFKIGDRVRVQEITDPARPEGYRKLSGEFGVVADIYDIGARVRFPQFMDHFILPFKSLKKEFAVGDRVKTPVGDSGLVISVPSEKVPNTYEVSVDIRRYSANPYFNVEDLTYIPEDKSPLSFTAPCGFNEDKQSENRLDRGTHKIDLKFITKGDDEVEALKNTIKETLSNSLAKRDNTTIMKGLLDAASGKRSNAMSTVFENIYGVQTTYAATIVLANGETVNIPDPDEKCWELKRTTKFEEIHTCYIDVRDNRLCIECFGDEFFAELQDEQARCWAKDMARIVNEEVDQGPFEKYFSYVTEIREYIRKPPQKEEEYPCCYSTLRNLW